MTTDVAEATLAPVPEAPVEQAPVQPEAVQAPPAGDAPETAAPESEESAPPAAFDFTELPEYKEAVTAPESSAAAAPDVSVGVPVEQVLAQVETQRATRQTQFLQMQDADWRGYLQNELGLSPQDAHSVWHGKLGPIMREVLSNNEAYNKFRFETAIDQLLPKESVDIYRSRQYRGQHEAIKALHDIGAASERAKWEAKVKAGDFIPKSQVKKIAEASYTKGVGGAGGSSSGQQLEGQAANMSASTEDQILANPNSDIKVVRKILARRNGEA